MDVETALREVRAVQHNSESNQHLRHRPVAEPFIERSPIRLGRIDRPVIRSSLDNTVRVDGRDRLLIDG